MGKLSLHQSSTVACSLWGFQVFPGPLQNGDRRAESGSCSLETKAANNRCSNRWKLIIKHESLAVMWISHPCRSVFVVCDVKVGVVVNFLSSCRCARLDGRSEWHGGSSIITGSDRPSVKPICQLLPSSHLTVTPVPPFLPDNPRTPRPSRRSVVVLQVPAYLLLLIDRHPLHCNKVSAGGLIRLQKKAQ